MKSYNSKEPIWLKNGHFSRQNIPMAHRHMRRCSTSSIIRGNSKPQRDVSSHLLSGYHPEDERQMRARMRRKGNLRVLLMGMHIGAAAMENSMQFPQKVKNTTTIWSSNSTPKYWSERNENAILNTSIPMFIATSFTITQTRKNLTIHQWMNG